MKKTEEDVQKQGKKKEASKALNGGGNKSASSKTALDSILAPKQRKAQESKDVFNVNGKRQSLLATKPAGKYGNGDEAK
jgi:hypothetical protein